MEILNKQVKPFILAIFLWLVYVNIISFDSAKITNIFQENLLSTIILIIFLSINIVYDVNLYRKNVTKEKWFGLNFVLTFAIFETVICILAAFVFMIRS